MAAQKTIVVEICVSVLEEGNRTQSWSFEDNTMVQGTGPRIKAEMDWALDRAHTDLMKSVGEVKY